ncbi:hypothetical protein APHAL10511_007362 [Amanita phalloides]|nr:hypothetical protein APHAL10511_007362 [Amanita phalloides]
MINYSQPQRRYLKNRQNDPLTVLSASGIDQSSSLVVATNGATSAPALAVDTTATAAPTNGAITLAGTSSLTVTNFSPTPTNTSSTAVGATAMLPMKTVIASCVAALVGALLLILLGLVMYRRYLRSLQQTYMSPKDRNNTREVERRRSHLEPWNMMGDEKSDDMHSKTDCEAPMHKMFKKPASVRTIYTHKSEEPMTLEMPQSLAQYHPSLASKPSEAVTVHRPCLESAESGPIISWDADMLGQDASQQLSARSAGNTMSIAIPTPVATRTLHRWESAEVINPDAEEKMPSSTTFQNEAERRKSTNNPFFKGTDPHMRTRSNSLATLKSDKTKDRCSSRATYDSDATTIPRPPIAYHVPSSSRENALNNSRAMESLIRALDVTEEEVQRRLRIVSMQPSVMTSESVYTIEATDATTPPPSDQVVL